MVNEPSVFELLRFDCMLVKYGEAFYDRHTTLNLTVEKIIDSKRNDPSA